MSIATEKAVKLLAAFDEYDKAVMERHLADYHNHAPGGGQLRRETAWDKAGEARMDLFRAITDLYTDVGGDE